MTITGRTCGGEMQRWDLFKSFKQRGEWVELQFMAQAASHGLSVLKPHGDSLQYDVVIDSAGHFLRVQVKGFSAHHGRGGYLVRLRRGGGGAQRYRSEDLDFFAVYILPANAWYLIPSARVLLPTPKMWLRFYPDGPPRRGRHTSAHDYEPYREAWGLLSKNRKQLKDVTPKKIQGRARL
jgi:hypothetical protein